MTRPLLIVLATLGLAPACATPDPQPARPDPTGAADPSGPTGPIDAAPADKPRAPVALFLTAGGQRDALTLTLVVRATADIPRAVARFTLPADVEVVSGALEQDLGARPAGSETTVTLVVAAPATTAVLFAGVDCHLTSGVKLYGVTELTLAAPKPPGRDGVGPSPDGVRATPARPRP